MKRGFFGVFLFFFPLFLFGQSSNFEEDFNSQDLSGWLGDTAHFVFTIEGGNTLLRQDATDAGISWLSHPSTDVVGYWEFFLRLDGFSPANGNKAEIYLMSDSEDLTSALNGYKLRAGETGSDDVFRLYRITNGDEEHEVLSGTTSVADGGNFRVKVTRDASGKWSLEVADSYAGALTQEANGFDDTYLHSTHFGFKNTYTSTRSDLFYYDFKIDIPPVEVSSISQFSDTELDISFSREIDFASVQNSDFSLNPGNLLPQTVSEVNATTARIQFSDVLTGGLAQLSVSNINDISVETALADTTLSFYIFNEYQPGDVVINEFLKDPPAGAAEYVELKNTSSHYLNLRDWKIGDNNNSAIISNSDFVFLPDSFVVITSDSNAISSFYGDAYFIQTSHPTLNNTGSEQIRIFDPEELLVDSLEYNSSWGGSKIALERRSQSVPGIYQENWAESPASAGGTPGRSNKVESDKAPPSITFISIPDDQTLLIAFSERVLHSEAEDISNYSLSQIPEDGVKPPALPAIGSVTQIAADTVQILLNAPLQEYKGTWSLEITNITDIFGNTSDDGFEFQYYVIFTAESGQVSINEFMYDPAPDYSEFIELYNHSDSTFDLQDWTLNDNTGTLRSITNSSKILPAGEYILLVPDNSISEIFPDVPFIEMSSRFPALNNGNDAIVIRNEKGTLIDSLTYFSSWGGNEVSLERRTANVLATFEENWDDSPSNDYGTPGFENLVGMDTEPPEIKDLVFFSEDSIRIIFSERLDSIPASLSSNYSVSPGIGIEEVIYQRNEIILPLTTDLEDGVSYTVSTFNQKDVFGNMKSTSSFQKNYVLFSPAAKYDVLINEILYKKADADSPEFIELYNNSDRNFDLSNWTFSDAVTSASLPEGISLKSGEYLVLTDKEKFGIQIPNAVYLSAFPSLNDAEDVIVIKNTEGLQVDSLFYSSYWGGSQGGVSIERKDPDAASNDTNNWAENKSETGFSAGFPNSVYEPDTIPPDVIFAKVKAEQKILVAFSEFVNLSGSEITLNDRNASISSFDENNANIAIIEAEHTPVGEKISVTISNFSDVVGNMKTQSSVEAAQVLREGSVVINEILFDPLANADDNLPDQAEYIELYNREDFAISLEGFYLHDKPDENGDVRSIHPDFTDFKWIPSKGYVLIYAEDQSPDFSESKVKKYFELNEQDPQFTIRVNRNNLSLASSGDAVYLADSSGNVIDSVFYDVDWHNPNLHNTKGISLEKIDPDNEGNDPSNWSSSTNISGGTPGYQNSIFQQVGAGPEEIGISFSPNPFSPDDDGFDDNLFINYNLDQPDYLLRVRIFDRYGRLVRSLADGKAAGFKGSLIWDGFTDDRHKNRVGFCIVLFEAYNSTQGKRKTFKKTVVLARKFR